MNPQILDQLATIIVRDRDALLAKWREQVRELPSAKHLDSPTLNDHIPSLIDELAIALRIRDDQTIPESLREGSPPAHGLQRLKDGFDIEEVVAEYNILRGCIHDLADANNLKLQGRPFHIINKVLDGAIGLAVQTYSNQRAKEMQQKREEYLAFVAHDLRTPLNAITLAAKVLELTFPERSSNGGTSKMMKALHRNVQQLAGLVSKVIEENSNLQTELGVHLQRRTFDLWPLVESLIHDLHPVAESGNTQLLNAVPDDLIVYADASSLRRIFQNLIANAIRHTPGGQVTIGAQIRDVGTECWVSDNGEGISDEMIGKVFDKGETDTHNEGGTGLGLAIVKTFTEAHGGEVTLESTPGASTTFRLTLPGRAASKIE